MLSFVSFCFECAYRLKKMKIALSMDFILTVVHAPVNNSQVLEKTAVIIGKPRNVNKVLGCKGGSRGPPRLPKKKRFS